jgi:hypothetical protein
MVARNRESTECLGHMRCGKQNGIFAVHHRGVCYCAVAVEAARSSSIQRDNCPDNDKIDK